MWVTEAELDVLLVALRRLALADVLGAAGQRAGTLALQLEGARERVRALGVAYLHPPGTPIGATGAAGADPVVG